MPPFLASLLHRTRASLLALLIVVLPLQGAVQLLAGLQGHRHVHTGAVAARHEVGVFAHWAQPLKAVLDRLHGAQDARLQPPEQHWLPSVGAADGLHQHGGVFHKHSATTADALDVGEAADDAMHEAGATAFLAWLPTALALPADLVAGDRPASAAPGWRSRVIEPLLAPPRG